MKRRLIRKSMLRALWMGLVLTAASQSTAAMRDLEFQVFLDERPIGYHRFTLRGEGTERQLTSEARFNVKLWFINAYRYAHDATEAWRDNCIETMTARTQDGGKNLEVIASRDAGHLAVTSPRGRDVIQGCVMSFAYWNPEILRQSHLLNVQTGEYTPVRIDALGEEQVKVRGSMVTASRYRIRGPKFPIDLWYSADRTWVALQSTVDRGRSLRYELK
ncbi:MAG: DUF6134 family protein [Burkholderiales bacterium]